MSCKHCMGGCKHEFTRDIYENVDIGGGMFIKAFKGYEHGCSKNPEGYAKWWEDNSKKVSTEGYEMDCFEPTELVDKLMKMNELAQNILDKLNEKNKL